MHFCSLIKLTFTVPSESPENFNGTIVSSYSISFYWNPPPKNHQNGVIISYQLRVMILETGVNFNYTTSDVFIEVTGLTPFTTYSCIVAAETSIGLGPFTQEYLITTPEDGK